MTAGEDMVSSPDAGAIERRTLAALAGNRVPGFHFAGYFLGFEWPHVGERDIVQTVQVGPHCTDAGGSADPALMGVHVDGVLASSARRGVDPGARLATVNLTLQYTGDAAASGPLSGEATLEGFYDGGAVRHAITRGVISSAGRPVCYASGTFVVLPPPPDVKLGPLPWEAGGTAPLPLQKSELTATERSVVRAARAAVKAADSQHAFIERFWGILPKTVAGGALCRVRITPQIGNRVGHVQGGILLGLAQATASAAVPGHPAVSTISAWYISPGNGKSLTVRSKIVHAGRSFAVVKTEIRNADKSLVLEAVSNHASLRTA
jgi:acyl-coenzyme A thioesterase PaaI-like protein